MHTLYQLASGIARVRSNPKIVSTWWFGPYGWLVPSRLALGPTALGLTCRALTSVASQYLTRIVFCKAYYNSHILIDFSVLIFIGFCVNSDAIFGHGSFSSCLFLFRMLLFGVFVDKKFSSWCICVVLSLDGKEMVQSALWVLSG